MMPLLVWLYVIAAVIFLFGAAVFVHEFGHFLVARWCGLKVEAFSIGFGPKIFGWKRDGIDYAWRWIPAGGYVKLPQMITSEALEGKSEGEVPVPPASAWAKILVAVAGPIMNGLFAFVLASVIYVVGLPVRVNPAIIGEVEAGSPEAAMGIKAGDRIISVNSKMVKSWEDAQMTVALAKTNTLPVTIERQGRQFTYWLTATVNPQLGLKLLNLDPMQHPVVGDVRRGSAAERDGLKKGDQILGFAGVRVVGQEQLVRLIKERPEKVTPMEILRGKERLTLTVTPRRDPTTSAGLLGIIVEPDLTSVYEVQRPGPPPWKLVGDVCGQTFATIGALVHSRQTGVGIKDLSGPPGILAMLAVELKADYRLALKFMVLLNISLAIVNLLPLPVLDGGHIVMALVERVRGRPLSPRIQEYATTVFALLLISFMVYVSYNDVVKRFPLFRTMFNQQVEIDSDSASPAAPAPVGK